MFSRIFSIAMLALLFFSCFTLAANPDADLAEGNNFYQDEEDEYIVEDSADTDSLSAQPVDSFDFVVEEEDEKEDPSEQQAYFLRANFLDSTFLFPQSVESKVILLGEENELLVGLTNKYDKTVNVTAIRLSIMHPMEPSFYYLQNCSVETYFQVLAPRATQTYRYSFTPDAMLQPRDYVVVANVYFEVPEENQRYVYQAVNFTHDFEDAPTKFDFQIVFIIASIAGVFGFFGYLILNYFDGGKTRRTVDRTAAPVSSNEVKEEWISHLNTGKSKKKTQK